MAYIIVKANGTQGQEIERRELTKLLTIGRSLECDVAVHDVLLSRRHCRFEPRGGERWAMVDLCSKNGTHLNWKKVAERVLQDGDALRMGRTWVVFRTGAFVAAPPASSAGGPRNARRRQPKTVRPLDPFEALSGTMADFVYVEPDDRDAQDFDAAPSPRHRPAEPQRDDALHELSSTWDAVSTVGAGPSTAKQSTSAATAAASEPRLRTAPRPMPQGAVLRRRQQQRTEAALQLQVHSRHVPYLETVPALPRKRRRLWAPLVAVIVGVCLATAAVLLCGWIMAMR